jgi:hypothetical protein
MAALLLRLALALTTGVIFVCWSELAFWARPFAGTSPAEMVPTTLAYSIAAYLFLAIVARFQARSAEAVFLAAAIFGWFVEGVIVQTMYEDLPLSISFTGLAWHAVITVMVGWRLLPRMLAAGRPLPLLALVTGLGIAFGLWSMIWWVEAPPATPPIAYAGYTLVMTAILAAAYALSSRPAFLRFEPSRVEWIILVAIVLALFAFVAVPAAPVAIVILPPLAALAVLGLRQMQKLSSPPSPEGPPVTALRLRRLAALLLIPLTASATYTAGFAVGAEWPTAIVLYLITTPLGFILLARSLWIAFRRTRVRPS